MATETVEMQRVSTTPAVVAAHGGFGYNPLCVTNRGNCAVALIFAALLCCAAVGLGSGDWYTIEASWINPVAGGPFPGSNFNTAVFGLRVGYYCNAPASIVPFGGKYASSAGPGALTCLPYTYNSKIAYYQNLHDDTTVTDQTTINNAGDATTAYRHLVGSSDIIIALLAIAIVLTGIQFLANILLAYGWGVPFRAFPGKITLVVVIILEALVLIFWITIFPYSYFHDQEPNLALGAPRSYDIYHTLGLGFSIQIAGLLIGILALFWYPRDVIVVKQTTVV